MSSVIILILSLNIPTPSFTEAVLIKAFNVIGGLMEGLSGSLLSEGVRGGMLTWSDSAALLTLLLVGA